MEGEVRGNEGAGEEEKEEGGRWFRIRLERSRWMEK